MNRSPAHIALLQRLQELHEQVLAQSCPLTEVPIRLGALHEACQENAPELAEIISRCFDACREDAEDTGNSYAQVRQIRVEGWLSKILFEAETLDTAPARAPKLVSRYGRSLVSLNPRHMTSLEERGTPRHRRTLAQTKGEVRVLQFREQVARLENTLSEVRSALADREELLRRANAARNAASERAAQLDAEGASLRAEIVALKKRLSELLKRIPEPESLPTFLPTAALALRLLRERRDAVASEIRPMTRNLLAVAAHLESGDMAWLASETGYEALQNGVFAPMPPPAPYSADSASRDFLEDRVNLLVVQEALCRCLPPREPQPRERLSPVAPEVSLPAKPLALPPPEEGTRTRTSIARENVLTAITQRRSRNSIPVPIMEEIDSPPRQESVLDVCRAPSKNPVSPAQETI